MALERAEREECDVAMERTIEGGEKEEYGMALDGKLGVYYGRIQNGVPDGYGRLFAADEFTKNTGPRATGLWLGGEDCTEETGEEAFFVGTVFETCSFAGARKEREGVFDRNLLPHGWCTVTTIDASDEVVGKVEGEWRHGKKSGVFRIEGEWSVGRVTFVSYEEDSWVGAGDERAWDAARSDAFRRPWGAFRCWGTFTERVDEAVRRAHKLVRRYEGETCDAGRPHGWGMVRYYDAAGWSIGDCEGRWKNGKRHGVVKRRVGKGDGAKFAYRRYREGKLLNGPAQKDVEAEWKVQSVRHKLYCADRQTPSSPYEVQVLISDATDFLEAKVDPQDPKTWERGISNPELRHETKALVQKCRNAVRKEDGSYGCQDAFKRLQFVVSLLRRPYHEVAGLV